MDMEMVKTVEALLCDFPVKIHVGKSGAAYVKITDRFELGSFKSVLTASERSYVADRKFWHVPAPAVPKALAWFESAKAPHDKVQAETREWIADELSGKHDRDAATAEIELDAYVAQVRADYNAAVAAAKEDGVRRAAALAILEAPLHAVLTVVIKSPNLKDVSINHADYDAFPVFGVRNLYVAKDRKSVADDYRSGGWSNEAWGEVSTHDVHIIDGEQGAMLAAQAMAAIEARAAYLAS